MTKYHVNPMGDVHPCKAVKQCRFGLSDADHADTPEEARSNYEARMNKVSGFSGLRRGFTDADRAKRQVNDTADKHLLAKFGSEAVEEALTQEVRQREIGLTYMSDTMGGRILGLAYGGDFRSEEESGMNALYKFYETGKDQAETVHRVSTSAGEAYVFIVPKTVYGRTDDRAVNSSIEDAVTRVENGEKNVGEFHYGRALVAFPENEVEREILERLKDAANHNALRLGSSSNPFSRGTMFYDDRDLSVGMKREVEASKKWAAAELEKTNEVREKFKAAGQAIYAISRPTTGFKSLLHRDEEVDPNETYYWLNSGSVPALGGKQAYGYYTLKELEAMADGDWSLPLSRQNT